MDFCIDAEQLRAALKEIERAEKNGFAHCLAVFWISSAGKMIDDTRATYSDLVEKAHPTDGEFNWGRFQGVSKYFKFNKKNKTLKEIPQRKTIKKKAK